MHAEDVALPQIAEAVGTPAYVYSSAAMERQAARVPRRAGRRGRSADRLLRSRPIPMPPILATLAKTGLGADVVSGGEHAARPRCRHSGRARSSFPASARAAKRCVYALAGKASSSSTSNLISEAEMLSRSRPGQSLRGPGRLPHQSRRSMPERMPRFRPATSDNKFGIAEHRRDPRLCPRRRAARPSGAGDRRSYRQPADQSRSARSAPSPRSAC